MEKKNSRPVKLLHISTAQIKIYALGVNPIFSSHLPFSKYELPHATGLFETQNVSYIHDRLCYIPFAQWSAVTKTPPKLTRGEHRPSLFGQDKERAAARSIYLQTDISRSNGLFLMEAKHFGITRTSAVWRARSLRQATGHMSLASATLLGRHSLDRMTF